VDEETEKIYFDYKSHLIDSRRQSYEQFDKAIFLLSGGGLAVSLTILKNLVPFQTAQYKSLLASTWIFFTLPLVLTLLSFILSRCAIDKQLQYADEYFLEGNQDALKKKNVFSKITECLNIGSGISFLIGVISLLVFVYFNVW